MAPIFHPPQLEAMRRHAGGDDKVHVVANAIKRLEFLRRWRQDLERKPEMLKKLQADAVRRERPKDWKDAKARRTEELANCRAYFELLGWRPLPGGRGGKDSAAADDGVTEERLNALLNRAMARKVSLMKARASSSSRRGGAASSFTGGVGDPFSGDDDGGDINWFDMPWSSDGLQQLMDAEADAREAEQSRTHVGAADGSTVVKTPNFVPINGTVAIAPPGGFREWLSHTVVLLSSAREDELRKMRHDLVGDDKKLAVYRAIKSQKFLETTQNDMRAREQRLEEMYSSMQRPRRILPEEQMQRFFDRLQADVRMREVNRAKAQAEADKAAKELSRTSLLLPKSVVYNLDDTSRRRRGNDSGAVLMRRADDRSPAKDGTQPRQRPQSAR